MITHNDLAFEASYAGSDNLVVEHSDDGLDTIMEMFNSELLDGNPGEGLVIRTIVMSKEKREQLPEYGSF